VRIQSPPDPFLVFKGFPFASRTANIYEASIAMDHIEHDPTAARPRNKGK
jgi:hypothetical protein